MSPLRAADTSSMQGNGRGFSRTDPFTLPQPQRLQETCLGQPHPQSTECETPDTTLSRRTFILANLTEQNIEQTRMLCMPWHPCGAASSHALLHSV